MLSQILLRCTCLISFAFTSLPVHCVPLLSPASFGFQHERKSSKGSVLSPISALSLGTKLRWLPIAQRIDDKISSLCYDVVSDTAPLYLSDLLWLYVPSRSLRSSADTCIFRIPTRKKKFQGQRTFSHLGPVTWNKLPYSVRHAQTQFQFKTLFRSVYEPDS